MTRKLFDVTSGLYQPAFFQIEICEDFNFDDWEANSDHQKSILLHEYIHYLQDISTRYSYENFLLISKQLQAYLYKAGTTDDKIIDVPINIEDIPNSELFSLLVDIYNGDNEFYEKQEIISVDIEPNEFLVFYHSEIAEDFPEVIVKTGDVEYRFGGFSIMESMAQLIETHIYPEEKRINIFPYNICELICQHIYPVLMSGIKNLVALCDASLLSVHPGLTFYESLKKMQEENYVPKTMDDVYDYVEKNSRQPYGLSRYREVDEMIDVIYRVDSPNTSALNKWLKDKFFFAHSLRRSKVDRSFITKVVNFEDKHLAENYLLFLMNELGLPLVTYHGELYYNGDDIGVELLYGSFSIWKIFLGYTDNQCAMYNFCSKQQQADTVCLEAPWEKSKQQKLCPFGQFWYSFGLEGKSIRKKCGNMI